MKSYPSSELRNVCDERVSEEPAEEGQDILQQMLDRRSEPLTHITSVTCVHITRRDEIIYFIQTHHYLTFAVKPELTARLLNH